MFDGLVDFDVDNTVQPGLAQSWEVSADGLRVTFRLREGVKWHDGKPFTSDDVKFSAAAWGKYNARGRIVFSALDRVETPDVLTAVFHLKEPAPALLAALAARSLPVIAKHSYPDGDADLAAAKSNNAPVGTGPFRFVEWERGSHIILDRNPEYWDKNKPRLDRIIIRILPDTATTSVALESGNVHVSSFIPLSNIERLKTKSELQVIDDPRGSLYNVGALVLEFNLDRDRWRDRRIREAFAHVIDRDFIQKNLYFGYATPTETPIPPGFAQYHNPDVPRYPYDLGRAEALLEEAGYKRDGSGIRLRLTNDPAANNATHTQVAQYLKGQLAKIGVDLQVRAQDFGQFVNRVYTARDFDTAIYHATVGPDPALGVHRFYWSKNFQPGVAFSNAANYNNPEVDQLLEAAGRELDFEKRKQLYFEFQKVVQTDLVRIPIVSPRYPIVASAKLRNLVTSPAGATGSFADTYFSEK
ncbi:ABC transporter substrate-binding protein [Lampropedia hyalina]|uniref:ABC transporter substrate-binding protein n=1 Tax=Lampropedia hyalina TaxID=198706 RepID=UPI0013566523|nr:ABC transporter substrate-binding protein [Lampropedia hyalina]